MKYTLAFASSDGVRVDRHFGAADTFYIAELDTELPDCEITGVRQVTPPCQGGEHETAAFAEVLRRLSDVSVIVAQRVGPGAAKYITEQGAAVYQIPLTIEQAVCLLMEEKQWEVDKWRSHTKN